MKGKLRGKFVLVLPAPPAPPPTRAAPQIQRLTDAELASMARRAAAATCSLDPGAQPGRLPRHEARRRTAGDIRTSRAGSRILRMGGKRAVGRTAQPTNAAAPAPAANTGMPSRAVVTRFYFDEGVAAMIEPGPVRIGAFFAITDTGETVPWKKDPTRENSPRRS